MKAWMRKLVVILKSSKLKKTITFGNEDEYEDTLNIDIVGYKYLSSLKDNFVVKISNLTYKEIVTLISGQYYDIEIKAGYISSGINIIFKGSVLYISNALNDRKTHTCIILCTSNLVAKFGQNRMNLSLQSGINMYSALKFICKQAGIQNSNVNEEFKNKIIHETVNVSSTVSSFLDNFCTNNSFVINSDSSYGTDISIWNPYRKDNRLIKLDDTKIILTSGYPKLTSDGLSIELLPTYNFMCGDTIQLDNSIIDISVYSKEETYSNLGYYLDETGKYMIYQIEYHLQNRNSDFSIKMLCKSRNLISRLTGIEGYING